jgi:hypothetical protein
MYNADGQFMFTSTPVLNEANASPSGGLTFPLVAAGAGYDTQLVLYGRSGQSGEGEIQVISRDGVPQTTSSLELSLADWEFNRGDDGHPLGVRWISLSFSISRPT